MSLVESKLEPRLPRIKGLSNVHVIEAKTVMPFGDWFGVMLATRTCDGRHIFTCIHVAKAMTLTKNKTLDFVQEVLQAAIKRLQDPRSY